MITKKTTPEKYCWTGISRTGGLTGGYCKNLIGCREQAKKENVDVNEKFMYFEGITPKDLLKKLKEVV
jgi:hypothetical protein